MHDLIEEKRARRIRYTKNAIEKQKRIAKSAHLPTDQPHRFSKHHATNCRTPNCVCCGNPRRVWKEKTLQEKKADLWTKE